MVGHNDKHVNNDPFLPKKVKHTINNAVVKLLPVGESANRSINKYEAHENISSSLDVHPGLGIRSK